MGRGPDWTADEYEALAKAFRAIGGDGIKGASQKGSKFDERVHSEFLKYCPKFHSLSPGHWKGRSKKACKNAWNDVRLQMGYFIATLNKANAMDPSGHYSEDEIVNIAIAIHTGATRTIRYEDRKYQRKNWKYYKAYEVLQHIPQFEYVFGFKEDDNDTPCAGGGKEKKTSEEKEEEKEEEEEEKEDSDGASASSGGDTRVRNSAGVLVHGDGRQSSAGGGRENASSAGNAERQELEALKKPSRERKKKLRGPGRDKNREKAIEEREKKRKERKEKKKMRQAQELIELGKERSEAAYIDELFRGYVMARDQNDKETAAKYYKEYQEKLEEKKAAADHKVSAKENVEKEDDDDDDVMEVEAVEVKSSSSSSLSTETDLSLE